MRVMTSLLYEIKPTDPFTFVGVSLVLLSWPCLRVGCLPGAQRKSIRWRRCDMNESKLKHLRRLKHFAPLRGSLFTDAGEGNSPRRYNHQTVTNHTFTMKLIHYCCSPGCLAVSAETEEQINKRFAVQPGGKLVVDVDFGSIDISANASSESHRGHLP